MRPREAVLAAFALLGLAACSEAPPPGETSSTTYSRIVTLAPNLTELVFWAGAGELLVGVSAYSDHPPQARELPVVGDAFMIDHEQLALLRPDLLLVWQGGTPAHVVDELRAIGYEVETLRTNSLDDVSAAIVRIGELTGRHESAALVATTFEDRMQGIRERYHDLPAISVFYQVSARPLYTVNGGHFVSELIELCGGANVFADLDELAPTIDVEAVVDRDPEVFMAGSDAGEDAFSEWQRWPQMAANRHGNHFVVPGDVISRATPRLLDGAVAVCEALEEARKRRQLP
ncbi:MAG: cobalamin-binding protein [Woeseiaceae bacterium]|nr:cobalamin-binding protein [Woeseiaceae bacterium]